MLRAFLIAGLLLCANPAMGYDRVIRADEVWTECKMPVEGYVIVWDPHVTPSMKPDDRTVCLTRAPGSSSKQDDITFPAQDDITLPVSNDRATK